MSLITATRPRHGNLRFWLLGLWPFWLFFILLLAAARYLLEYGPYLLLQSVLWQAQLHRHLAQLLSAAGQHPVQAGMSLALFSLTYGILHAVGPGHGKLVLATYLSTHSSRLRLSLGMTLAASLLQGLMAVLLVTLFLFVLHLSSHRLHLGEFWLEKGSYLLMALLGALLCLRAAARLRAVFRSLARQTGRRPRIGAVSLLPRQADGRLARVGLAPAADNGYRPVRSDGGEATDHGAHCGCGHRHMPAPEDLRDKTGWRTRAAVVLAMGFRPCSGAVLVLLFAKVIGVYGWGMLSAMAMSVGTSLTLLALALLSFWARRLAENLTRRRNAGHAAGTAWATLALAGGLVLMATGALLYLGAQPATTGVIHPFSH
ncbi:nickel/cobalt transporter [Martelella alba]|uniref:Nickel/cobalt efflux system n=1 Tax=Martelella alba TaxID=2590451 RepID=A0ABY2SLW7_9HYPH|nr:nickel/cobalt transporter [Martelella alba]TKI06758.1 nickel/cobalt transporter [Martelella alba]